MYLYFCRSLGEKFSNGPQWKAPAEWSNSAFTAGTEFLASVHITVSWTPITTPLSTRPTPDAYFRISQVRFTK